MSNFIQDQFVKNLLRQIDLKLETLNNLNSGVANMPSNYSMRVIDEYDASDTYIGYSAAGVSEATSTWIIKRVRISGTITRFAFAYNVSWDNRLTSTFS